MVSRSSPEQHQIQIFRICLDTAICQASSRSQQHQLPITDLPPLLSLPSFPPLPLAGANYPSFPPISALLDTTFREFINPPSLRNLVNSTFLPNPATPASLLPRPQTLEGGHDPRNSLIASNSPFLAVPPVPSHPVTQQPGRYRNLPSHLLLSRASHPLSFRAPHLLTSKGSHAPRNFLIASDMPLLLAPLPHYPALLHLCILCVLLSLTHPHNPGSKLSTALLLPLSRTVVTHPEPPHYPALLQPRILQIILS